MQIGFKMGRLIVTKKTLNRFLCAVTCCTLAVASVGCGNAATSGSANETNDAVDENYETKYYYNGFNCYLIEIGLFLPDGAKEKAQAW
jgi:hypothetical protein